MMGHLGNNRHGNKRHWNNGRKNGNDAGHKNNEGLPYREGKKEFFRPSTHLPQQVQADMLKDQETIREIKQKHPVCACCNNPIADLSTALADRNTGNPVHFDCVLNILNQSEKLHEGEKITYIGQGRFAVVSFPIPHDMRTFNIIRVIEWEPKYKTYPWREELTSAYSQVH